MNAQFISYLYTELFNSICLFNWNFVFFNSFISIKWNKCELGIYICILWNL